jgi:Mor family transcriptional regulator
MMPRKSEYLEPQAREKIPVLLIDGYRAEDLAKRYRVTPEAIYNVARQAGLQVSRRDGVWVRTGDSK